MTLDAVVLGNPILRWALAGGLAAGTFLVLVSVRNLAARRVAVLARTTSTRVDDLVAELLEGTRNAVLLVAALAVGAAAVTLPAGGARALGHVLTLAFILQGFLWVLRALKFAESDYVSRKAAENPGAATSIRALGFVARLGLGSLAAILALDNLGVNITTLVAGLGIGGVAVALAVQNILGDLFASLSIILDRPFVQGDVIVVGEFTGTVERVGLKTTRLRSVNGEQIIFSNTDLLGSRIRNFKRMNERRVAFTLGVTYETPEALLREVGAIVRRAIEAQPKARFDRVHFKAFGPSSLDFEAVYFVTNPEFVDHMDVQEAVGFEILRRFREAGIEFAFPTQTVHMASAPAAGARA